MAWQKILGNVKSLDYDFQCLSTDTKPTTGMEVGAKAYEFDTGAKYKFNGAAWVVIIDDSTAIGTKADVAATVADTTPFSVVALLKGIWNKLGALVFASTGKKATATVTIGTGAAHSAGDVVSTDAGAIIQFTTGLSAAASGVILASYVTLNQNAVFAGGAGYTLYLFNASPTAQATNAAYSLAAADEAKAIGKIAISTLVDTGEICTAEDLYHNKPFVLATGDTKLYGKLVCNGGETTVGGKIITINLIIAAL